MAAEKYSVSMDDQLLREARASAEQEGLSLSAWIATAVRDRLRLHHLHQAILDYEQEHGEITPEEMQAVRAEIDGGQRLAS